ncbi:type II secretion system GspH family protein [Candidatus Gracilibacteria bacterium]|nr:type II secretion system GspH family protein [Candidatus Gracilibacteria bacterium]
MLKNFFNKKGETLIEIMIAIVILSTVLIAVSNVLGNSKITAKSSEQRIEAVALAKEGLEIFRYVRKENYMQYSDKKRICWNFVIDNDGSTNPALRNYGNGTLEADGSGGDDDKECEENSDSSKAGSANYIFEDGKMYLPLQNLSDSSYGRFFLSSKGQDLNEIWVKKDDGDVYSDLVIFQLCRHKDTGLIMSCESMGFADDKKEKLPYFRVLKMEYVNHFGEKCSGTNGCDTTKPKSLNQIKVTSTVIWSSGPGIQSVDLTTIFTDYEDRGDRES